MRIVYFVIFLFVFGIGCKPEKEVKTVELKDKKVLMIIASKDFRDEEYLEPKKILSDAGAKVVTASTSLAESVGMLGAKVKPDILISNVKVNDYDAIIFVGGTGSDEYWDNSTAHNIAYEATQKNKILAAICIAPVTLANAGLLKNKKATSFSSVKGHLSSKGAKYTGSPVEQDGKLITGYGPEAAFQFGEVIKKALSTK